MYIYFLNTLHSPLKDSKTCLFQHSYSLRLNFYIFGNIRFSIRMYKILFYFMTIGKVVSCYYSSTIYNKKGRINTLSKNCLNLSLSLVTIYVYNLLHYQLRTKTLYICSSLHILSQIYIQLSLYIYIFQNIDISN